MDSTKPRQIPQSDIFRLDLNSPNDAAVAQPAVIKQANPKPVVDGMQLGSIAINPASLRKGFIRKVLTILSLQLLFTTIAIILTFIDKTGAREFMQKHRYGLWIALGISFFIMIVLACFRNLFRKVPLNYMLLILFTCSISYMMASIAAVTKSTTVIFAGGFTLFIVFCVACYAWRAKTDLTKKPVLITVLIAALFLLLIFGPIFRSRIANVAIGCAIAFVFGILLAVDLQRLSGKYSQKYSLDDYVIAALDLYIDIVQMFLAILGVSSNVNN